MFRYLFILLISINCIAQDHIESSVENKTVAYKKMYAAADRLKLIDIGRISAQAKKTADSLSRFHPKGYFESALNQLNKEQYNDAAFLYYLGYLRYSFFNEASPKFDESDEKLFQSIKSENEEPIGIYLQSNGDNFIAILQKSLNYNKENNYRFFPGENAPDTFNALSFRFSEIITDLQRNLPEYSATWKVERKAMEKYIDDALKDEQH